MRWESGRRSDNIEDRRGMGLGGKGLVGGGIGTVVIALIALFMGVDPGMVLNQMAETPTAQQGPRAPADPREEKLKEFVSVVLADTEDTWGELFRRSGGHYEQPRLVLFSGAVQSACGHAQAAMGPFYCPGDHKLYLDMSFFDDLARRHNAPGDFAQAYVIAHEVGHHVQTLLGIAEKVHAARQQAGEVEANRMQVRMELQADCFAGIWANRAQKEQGVIEPGDIDEALGAASAVGDDTLQKQATGRVMPDSFTHGSAAQRQRWFKTGYQSGDINACDTFNAKTL